MFLNPLHFCQGLAGLSWAQSSSNPLSQSFSHGVFTAGEFQQWTQGTGHMTRHKTLGVDIERSNVTFNPQSGSVSGYGCKKSTRGQGSCPLISCVFHNWRHSAQPGNVFDGCSPPSYSERCSRQRQKTQGFRDYNLHINMSI